MVAEIQARALQIGGFQPPYLRSLPLFWRTRANLGRGAAHQARSRCEAQKPSKPLLSPAGVPSLPGPVPRSSYSWRVHHLLPSVLCSQRQPYAGKPPACGDEQAWMGL